jgi:hypothetical protein
MCLVGTRIDLHGKVAVPDDLALSAGHADQVTADHQSRRRRQPSRKSGRNAGRNAATETVKDGCHSQTHTVHKPAPGVHDCSNLEAQLRCLMSLCFHLQRNVFVATHFIRGARPARIRLGSFPDGNIASHEQQSGHSAGRTGP